MTRLKIFSILMALILAGCSLPGSAEPTPATVDMNSVMTAAAATAFTQLTQIAATVPTLPPTTAPTSELSLAPTIIPTVMPTIEPIIGIVKTATNIREGPGGSNRVGGLFANGQVKVIGRNPAADWLWIMAEVPGGTGWVSTGAINLNGDLTILPIVTYENNSSKPVVFPPFIYTITGTPLPLNTPAPGVNIATIEQVANVRIGPSVGYSSMGTLKLGTVATLTGRTNDKVWLQIEYPSGPGGRGWILASLCKKDKNNELSTLQNYNLLGTPNSEITEGAPVSAPSESPAETSTPDTNPAQPATETPVPVTPIPEGPTGIVKAQINVRIGPAQKYDSVGLLNPNEVVKLTGRNLIGNWFQIEYPAGPNGRGWVAADYIKLNGVNINNLPFFNNEGTPNP